MDIKQTQKILDSPAHFTFTIEDIILIIHALDNAISNAQDYLKKDNDPKVRDDLSDLRELRSHLKEYLKSTGYIYKQSF